MTALIAVGDWLSSKPMFHATQETVNMADNVSQILVACRAANVDFTAPGSMILCAEQTVIHTITHALWELLDVIIRRILLGFTLGSVVSTTNLGARGLLLGILGGSVPPGSPNPDPVSDQKCFFFSHPFSELASKIHTHSQTLPLRNMSSLLRLEQQQKRFFKTHFEFAYFSFFVTHLELKQ